MSERARSVPGSVFEARYADNPDPWGFETSAYEHEKYQTTLNALPHSRYAAALEIGCSIGVFTELLAARCDDLLAVDVAARAVEMTRARCAHLPQVRCRRLRIPEQFPRQCFDLIVLSEVGYYWSRIDLIRAAELMIESASPGGQIILVHWTPPIGDAPLTGDQVHDVFRGAATELDHLAGLRTQSYRLDVYQRPQVA